MDIADEIHVNTYKIKTEFECIITMSQMQYEITEMNKQLNNDGSFALYM